MAKEKVVVYGLTTEGYFIDRDKTYYGKINLIELINSNTKQAFDVREKKPIVLKPDTSILSTIEKLSTFVGESIPVVDPKNNKLLGIISESNVLKAYIDLSEQIKNIEKK